MYMYSTLPLQPRPGTPPSGSRVPRSTAHRASRRLGGCVRTAWYSTSKESRAPYLVLAISSSAVSGRGSEEPEMSWAEAFLAFLVKPPFPGG